MASSLLEFMQFHFSPNGYERVIPLRIIRETDYGEMIIKDGGYWMTNNLDTLVPEYKFKKQNYYISRNAMRTNRVGEDNILSYDNIVIDIDCHEKGICAADRTILLKRCVGLILLEFDSTEYPPPNSIVYTGRGIQLWWALESMSFKLKKQYDNTCKHLLEKVAEVLRTSDEYSVLELDRGASCSAAGLVRLPGSYNTKARKYARFERIHNYRIDAVAYSYDYCSRYSAFKHREALQKASETHAFVNVARKRVDMIRRLIELREGECSGYRHYMLTVAAASLDCIDADDIYETMEEINDMFSDPVKLSELYTTIRCCERHGYKLTNERIITWLDISEEELHQLEIRSKPKKLVKKTKRTRVAADKRAEIVVLAESMTQQQIAAEMHVSQATVHRILEKAGKAENGKKEKVRRRRQIRKMLKAGKTVAKICSETGISEATVRKEKTVYNNEIKEEARKEFRREERKNKAEADKTAILNAYHDREASGESTDPYTIACSTGQAYDKVLRVLGEEGDETSKRRREYRKEKRKYKKGVKAFFDTGEVELDPDNLDLPKVTAEDKNRIWTQCMERQSMMERKEDR